MSARRSSIGWVVATLLGPLVSAPLAAQTSDARWLAWLGCWEAGAGAAEEPMLCIVPATADVGVEMVAVANGQVVSRELVRADGEMQSSTREGCSGWERARFSSDTRRIYLDAEHLCGGSVRQESRGLLAMVSRTEWIDVRTLDAGGEPVTGVIHYTLAPSNVAEAAGFGNIAADQAMAVRAARISASTALSVDDVIDAHRVVGPDVVRTWVAERRQPFQIDADRLARMADSGVSPDVIDVMVAVSYPTHFNLGDGAQVSENGAQEIDEVVIDPGLGYLGRRGLFWNPIYGRGYGRYYYGDYYGYRDYYGYGGYYGYPGIYRPTIVVVEPREPVAEGRVVNGRGYTRSGSRSSGSGSGGSATSSGGSSSSSPPASSSGSEGGSSSSSGGTSTGRTAQPRNPGR